MTTLGTTHLTARDTNELAQTINRANAARIEKIDRRTNAACAVLLALAIGITLAMLLVDWSTPCNIQGALCGAAAIPTRPSLWRRVQVAWRRLYLRACISQATGELRDLETDLAHSKADVERLPMQIQAHKVWLNAHLDELDSLGLHPHGQRS